VKLSDAEIAKRREQADSLIKKKDEESKAIPKMWEIVEKLEVELEKLLKPIGKRKDREERDKLNSLSLSLSL
jgi:hypothetical protein